MIRAVEARDAEALARIYNHYVTHSIVTFEEEPVGGPEMLRRVSHVESDGFPWLVAEAEGRVVGYAYASKWKERIGYRFSSECSVYLDNEARGQGWGTRLYGALFPLLRKKDLHLVIAGIGLPNDASVALHEKFGMTKVAHFVEVGQKFGKWVDVGYWQVRLDGRALARSLTLDS